MRLKDILENVIHFPEQKRRRDVMLDRLRKKSSIYDELTGERLPEHPLEKPEEFFVMDEDGKAHGTFGSYREAEKAIPRLEMKSGKRGLFVKGSIHN